MKKELSQIWKEMEAMKAEQKRHGKFLPKGDPFIEIEEEKKRRPNFILMFLRGILYFVTAIFMVWVLRR